MKAIYILFLFFGFTALGAATLINEGFSGYPSFPSGWTMSGPSAANWSAVSTNFAGGTAGELKFTYSPQNIGTYRFISPSFDTRKVHDMVLSFRHRLVDYSPSSTTYTIGVQISTDLTNWTNAWSITTSSDIAATQVSANISFERGKSLTTYIAIFFTGNTYEINNWYIDDVSLTYSNTLGSGRWAYGGYTPEGNLIIPNGYTLQLDPGVVVRFASTASLAVYGRLIANGTADSLVYLTCSTTVFAWNGVIVNYSSAANDSSLFNYTVISFCTQTGIFIFPSCKVRISNCLIYHNSGGMGGGITVATSSAIIEDSQIYDNSNESSMGGAAIYGSYCNPTIRNNQLTGNNAGGSPASTLSLLNCDVTKIQNNIITNNYFSSQGFAVYLYSCIGVFQRNLVANNASEGLCISSGSATVSNCDIINNVLAGIDIETSTTSITNSIVWGNSPQIYKYSTFAQSPITYCCVQGGFSGTTNVSSSYFQNNISANPLFVSPTTGTGAGYDALVANWHLQDLSPCIDAASPAYPHNPDGSIEDIGIYYRSEKPLLTKVADVTPDQGHQVDLQWNRNDIDVTYNFNAFYSVWRESTSRSENVDYVSNPSYITYGMPSATRDICWRDGTRTWYYLTQLPAMNYASYGYIAPTLQDSSSSGTHSVNYMVAYHNSSGYWPSISKSGYSVDNIPPYSASKLILTHISGNQFNMSWDAVTEGVWEGNSYPEINAITYKIYAGDSPEFDAGPATYLLSTRNPAVILTNQNGTHKFYKIITLDSIDW